MAIQACPNRTAAYANISIYLLKKFFPAEKLTYVCRAFVKI